ncbi:hypothetical protein Tco_1351410 [Tanacetum coccineum]
MPALSWYREETGVSPGNVQDDEDDDKNDNDENAQDDDDEAQSESKDDGDDFIHPKLTTHDNETTHEEETDEDDTFNPIVPYTSHVSSSIIRQVIMNLKGSSVSPGFVSNMLNPNQDTGVDAIIRHNAEATSLVYIPVTAIAKPSFFAPTNRPPTPTPLFTQLQQTPILTPATTSSSSLQNLPDFGSGTKEAKRSHAVAANLSELELKKILIDNIEANNSINKSDIQRQLYKALFDAYEADKILLDTYGDTVTIKRPRDGADDDQEPSAGIDRGSKRRRSGKEPESTTAPREKTTTTAGKTTTGSKTHKQSASQSAPVEETMQSIDVFEAPAHQEFETGVHDEQPEEEVHPLPNWFQQPKQLPSPDRAWNKSVPADHKSVQPWLSNLARRQDLRKSFDELTDTTFDFSAFVMNRLNVTTLTPELLAGLTFELMKGTCKSLTELEYFCKEVYKATTEKLDWTNPEGRQYPHDLRKPLPLVPNSQGRHVIPFHHFINNDLEYLRGGESSRKYSTSVTKTKAADYRHIKWIEDLVPNSMWITKVEIVEWQNYKHLDWITVRRDYDTLYKFKEGDFHRLRIQDIEDMLLLLVQGKLTNLNVEERLCDIILLKNVHKKSNLRRRDAYTPYSDPKGFIYENKDKKNRLMRIDELHKFSDGTLDDVWTALNDHLSESE